MYAGNAQERTDAYYLLCFQRLRDVVILWEERHLYPLKTGELQLRLHRFFGKKKNVSCSNHGGGCLVASCFHIYRLMLGRCTTSSNCKNLHAKIAGLPKVERSPGRKPCNSYLYGWWWVSLALYKTARQEPVTAEPVAVQDPAKLKERVGVDPHDPWENLW